MRKLKLYQQLEKKRLVAVIRGQSYEDALAIAHAAYEGGIHFLEITLTTPRAIEVIEKLTQEFQDNEQVYVGAGTVLHHSQATQCILAGAQFVVCPHIDESIIEVCHLYQIPVMAGAMSVNEAIHALKKGVEIIKLFPGSVFKPSIIKDFKGPLPQVTLMPTGGVSLENMNEWLKNGAFALGIGSDLTKEKTQNNYASVTQRAEEYVFKLNEKSQ